MSSKSLQSKYRGLTMSTINIIEAMALAQLQLKREISLQDIGQALGFTKQYISKIKAKNLTKEQIAKIESGLGISLNQKKEYYELPYLEIEGLQNQRMKNNLITTLWLDRELIENDWKKNYKNLRVTKMLGDKMDGGTHPLKNNNTLLVDMSETDPINSGIYVYTTENEDKKLVFISGISIQANGDIKFYFTSPKTYQDKIISTKELEKVNFSIIGRVIKNLSELL